MTPPAVAGDGRQKHRTHARSGARQVGRQIGLSFDFRVGEGPAVPEGLSDERCRLALPAGSRPVMQSRWAGETTARRKFSGWTGEHGSLHGVRNTLGRERPGQTVTTWPAVAPLGDSRPPRASSNSVPSPRGRPAGHGGLVSRTSRTG